MNRAWMLPLLLALVACDTEAPPEVIMPQSAAELIPDPNYRLTAAQRERLAPAFDPDAMESLFALYPNSEQRDRALADFLSMADQVARGEISMTGIRYLGDNAQERQAIRSLAERSPFSATQRLHTPEPD